MQAWGLSRAWETPEHLGAPLTKFLLMRRARGAHPTQSLGHPHAENPHP